MRNLAILFAVAAALAPACGAADPVQTQAAATPQATTTTPPTATVTPRTPTAETVTVTVTARAPSADPDEIVCLMSPARTGSRIGGSRECHTNRQWEQLRKDSQSMLSSIQMRGMQGPSMSTDIRQMGH